MKTLFLITALMSTLAISACSKEKIQTVEWYKQNAEALTLKLAECENNPGEKKDTPNCINAQAAAMQAGRFKNLVTDGLVIASSVRSAVTEYYVNYGKWPANNTVAGVASPDNIQGEGFSSVTVSNNTIRIVFTQPVTADKNNNDIILTAKAGEGFITWHCRGGQLPNELRPEECKIRPAP